MPADQEGKRAGQLNLSRSHLDFLRAGWEGKGGRDAGGSSSQRWRCWYAHQSIGMRRCGRLFSFEFSLFVSHGLGGVGEKGVLASLYPQ